MSGDPGSLGESCAPPGMHLLDTSEGAAALAMAASQADPSSLAAASALRKGFVPEVAAAALQQEHLRRRARTKFGDRAHDLLFTAAGLEQATRPAVAAWRARRLVDAGAQVVIDLGCGIGADALACCDAGLRVIAVELDAETAACAAHNLRGREAEVICGDAVALAPELLARAEVEHPGAVAVFCDPARRTDRGRTWRVDQFTPPWEFVLGLLASGRPTCIKMGPGLPSELVPDDCETRWVSVGGDVVEAGLWSLPSVVSGRAATLLSGASTTHELGPLPRVELPVSAARRYLYEPDGAVLRAGVAAYLAGGDEPARGMHQLAPGVGYLTSDELIDTPFATAFEVVEVMDAGEKALRAWVRERRVGTLEIKKRAVDIDPAVLRKRLRPSGPNQATLVVTPMPDGVRCLVVNRLSR